MTMLVMLAYQGLYAQTNPLVGSWLLDVDKSIQMMSGEMRQRYDSLSTDGKVRVKTAMNERFFNFQENGTIQVLWKVNEQPKESFGVWAHGSEAGLIIITIDSNPQEFEYSFEGSELQLRNRQITGFFTTLCFNRQ